MPPRSFIVLVPAPCISSIISGAYPCALSRRAPSCPLYFFAMWVIPLATQVKTSSQEIFRNSSWPRESNLYLLRFVAVSYGKPSSAHCFHPFRIIGYLRRYGPSSRRASVYPLGQPRGCQATVALFPYRSP